MRVINNSNNMFCLYKYLVGLLILLFLGGCANKTPVPFYFTGAEFIATSPESAEEIVLRANRYEQDAIVSAGLGYFHGVGGFPKDMFLASRYLLLLKYLGEVEEFEFLKGYINYNIPDKSYGIDFIFFDKKLVLMQAMQKAGLYSPESIVQRDLLNRSAQDRLEIIQEDIKEKSILRAYVSAVLENKEPLDARLFFNSLNIQNLISTHGMGIVLFHAATLDQGFPKKPRWDSPNIVKFLTKIREKNLWYRQEYLEYDYCQVVFGGDEDAIKKMFCSAHAGDPIAIGNIAASYYSGAPGFPKSQQLGDIWIDVGRDIVAPNIDGLDRIRNAKVKEEIVFEYHGYSREEFIDKFGHILDDK